MTRSYSIQVIDPKNPTGQKIEATIPGDLILRLWKYNPVMHENFETAKKVLENTKRIFTGLRAEHDGGWCYVGKPDTWFVKEGKEVSFPDNRVFAVYLNDRMVIFDFSAEYVDNDDVFSPKGWKDRYKGLVWKSTS